LKELFSFNYSENLLRKWF